MDEGFNANTLPDKTKPNHWVFFNLIFAVVAIRTFKFVFLFDLSATNKMSQRVNFKLKQNKKGSLAGSLILKCFKWSSMFVRLFALQSKM